MAQTYQLPVWDYYRKNFIHPDFYPYENWEKNYCRSRHLPTERRDLGMRFQLIHPTDPCPQTYEKKGSFCVKKQSEVIPVFYTKQTYPNPKSFLNLREENKIHSNEFTPKSINPFTGLYSRHYKEYSDNDNYKTLPTNNSYIS